MLTVPLITCGGEQASASCTDFRAEASLVAACPGFGSGFAARPGVLPPARCDPSSPLPSARAADHEMRSHTYPLAVADGKFNREFRLGLKREGEGKHVIKDTGAVICRWQAGDF